MCQWKPFHDMIVVERTGTQEERPESSHEFWSEIYTVRMSPSFFPWLSVLLSAEEDYSRSMTNCNDTYFS